MSAPGSIHHFTHEAMQTRFSLELHSTDPRRARDAAHAGIALIDEIESSLSRYIEGSLMIDPDKPAIHCLEAGREIDLGGIGKGFALDRVHTLLLDWGIDCALLSAGASTRLAFGDHAWPVSLPGTAEPRTVELRDQALSASGTAIQGSHIVSPRFNEHNYHHERIWVLARTATTADAWSTAALLMEPGELEAATPDDLRILTE